VSRERRVDVGPQLCQVKQGIRRFLSCPSFFMAGLAKEAFSTARTTRPTALTTTWTAPLTATTAAMGLALLALIRRGLRARFFDPQLIRGDHTIAVPVELVEQGMGRGGKFLKIDDAIAIPVLQRRNRGLVFRPALLIDRPHLIRLQHTVMIAVGSRKIAVQPLFQLLAGQAAIWPSIMAQNTDGGVPFFGPRATGQLAPVAATSRKPRSRKAEQCNAEHR